MPKDEPRGLYKLEVSSEDKTTLVYFLDDQLQRRWEIQKIPKAYLVLRNESANVAAQMDWFPEQRQPISPDEFNYSKLAGASSAWLQFNQDDVTELKILEEYHNGDQVETREYHLRKDKNDEFPFPEPLAKRYEGSGQYAIYTIEWAAGIYLIRLIFG